MLEVKKGKMMERQQNSSKEQTLAWFKLADLIARKEREKALNVFRLLAHSLPDRAYVLQLEGDILWYLDDKNATEKYRQAAFLYQKEKRWIDAIAIYEHLFIQHPDSSDILSMLLILYAVVDWPEKFQERFDLMLQFFNDHCIDEAQLEKVIKDILETAKFADEPEKKEWIIRWFDQVALKLPSMLVAHLNEKSIKQPL